MINIEEMITDPDFVQDFIILRSSGAFVDGVWTESAPQRIKVQGVVNVMNAKELNMLPEGDRISGGMNFHTTEEVFVTRTGQEQGTSDKIIWRGEQYKIFNVFPYVDYGYYKASGERIKGS